LKETSQRKFFNLLEKKDIENFIGVPDIKNRFTKSLKKI